MTSKNNCGVCKKPETKDKGDEIWIQCTECSQWFHVVCLKLTRIPNEDERWPCKKCEKKILQFNNEKEKTASDAVINGSASISGDTNDGAALNGSAALISSVMLSSGAGLNDGFPLLSGGSLRNSGAFSKAGATFSGSTVVSSGVGLGSGLPLLTGGSLSNSGAVSKAGATFSDGYFPLSSGDGMFSGGATLNSSDVLREGMFNRTVELGDRVSVSGSALRSKNAVSDNAMHNQRFSFSRGPSFNRSFDLGAKSKVGFDFSGGGLLSGNTNRRDDMVSSNHEDEANRLRLQLMTNLIKEKEELCAMKEKQLEMMTEYSDKFKQKNVIGWVDKSNEASSSYQFQLKPPFTPEQGKAN